MIRVCMKVFFTAFYISSATVDNPIKIQNQFSSIYSQFWHDFSTSFLNFPIPLSISQIKFVCFANPKKTTYYHLDLHLSKHLSCMRNSPHNIIELHSLYIDELIHLTLIPMPEWNYIET